MSRHKLSGSTLIEVLIAMVIIMVVFAIAMGVFSNVLSSGVSLRKVRVNQQLESLRIQTVARGKVEETQVIIDSIDYQFVITSQPASGTEMVEIKANDHGHATGSIRFLVKKNQEDEKN